MSRRYPLEDGPRPHFRLDLVCPDNDKHRLGTVLREPTTAIGDGAGNLQPFGARTGIWSDGEGNIVDQRRGLHVHVDTATSKPVKVEGVCHVCRSGRRPQLRWTRIVAVLDEMERANTRLARLPMRF